MSGIHNLGVVFDSNMHMNKQVNPIVKSNFMSIQDIYKVRDFFVYQWMPDRLIHVFIPEGGGYFTKSLGPARN